MRLFQLMFNPRVQETKISIGINEKGETLVYVQSAVEAIKVTKEHPIDILLGIVAPTPFDIQMQLDVDQS